MPRVVGVVGRALELAELEAALARAADANGEVVVILGEPGIGKTRLAREALERARARGFLTLEGRAYALEAGLGYAPIVAALGPFLRGLGGVRRSALTSGLPSLARLFTDLGLGSSESVGDPTIEKVQLFEAVARLTERLAGEQPLLMFLDDLHCADTASLELVHYLARGVQGQRMLLLATAWDDPDSLRSLRSLLSSLRRNNTLRELRLARLENDAIRQLVHHLLGGAPPAALLEQLTQRSGGVPLFAEALVEALIETGRLVRARDGWSLLRDDWAELPQRISDLILERVERLQPLDRRVLELLVVSGETTATATLEAAAGMDAQSVAQALGHLQTAGLVEEVVEGPGLGYRARHPSIQEAVYFDLSELARRRAHAQFVTALERHQAGDAESLARHYRGAGSEVDLARAIDVLLAAGTRALGLSAGDEAVANLNAAIALLRMRGDHTRLAGALESLGLAWEQLGELGAAAASWEECLLLLEGNEHTAAAGRLHGRLAFADWERGSLESADAHLKRGMSLMDGQPTADMVDLLVTQVRLEIRRGAIDRASEYALRLSQLVASGHSLRDAVKARFVEAQVHQARIEPADAFRASQEAFDLAVQSGDVFIIEEAESSLVRALSLQGEHLTVRAHAENIIQLARRLMAPHLEARALLMLGAATLYAGDWAAIHQLGATALELARRAGQARISCTVLVYHAIGASLRGDHSAAQANLSAAVDEFAGMHGDANIRVGLQAARAVDAFERGDFERVEEVAGPDYAYPGDISTFRLEALGAARIARGDADGALAVATTLRRLAADERSLCTVEALRTAGLARALLGDRAVAQGELTRAIEIADAMALPFHAARCRLDLGRLIGGAAATNPLRASLATFEALGARGYADRARRALRDLGLVVAARATRSPGAELSEREREVACLVAQGLTTAEIAQRLYISYHTANTHLKRIYARLGVGSRTALARYVLGAGWLETGRANTTD